MQAVWHTVQDAGWKNIKINEEDFKKISGLRKKGGFAELADSPKFYLWQGEKKVYNKDRLLQEKPGKKGTVCAYDRRYFKVQQGVCGEKSV